MPRGIKTKQYKKSIQIFPEATYFDKAVAEFICNLILSEASTLSKPNRMNLADKLGILRFRLTRLMNTLGIEGDYKKIAFMKKGENLENEEVKEVNAKEEKEEAVKHHWYGEEEKKETGLNLEAFKRAKELSKEILEEE